MYANIAANKRKTVFIMFVFMAFVTAIIFGITKYLNASITGFYFGILATFIYVVITYYSGSRLALSVNGAKEIAKTDNPRLWRIIENLALTDGLPMPKVYIIDDPAPNAFATGRDPKHSAVCGTTGILDMMTDTELEGVFAHELSHIKNYDIRVSMIAFALSAVVSLIANFAFQMAFSGSRNNDNNNSSGGNAFGFVIGLAAAIILPIVAALIQFAVSRQREYLADASGALVTRYPEGLASALEKISASSSVMQKQNSATAHLFFANPLRAGSFSKLFSTHPPLADRIVRLRAMIGAQN